MVFGFPFGPMPPLANMTGVGGRLQTKQPNALGPAYVTIVLTAFGLTLIEGVLVSGGTFMVDPTEALGNATCAADSDEDPIGAVVRLGESIE